MIKNRYTKAAACAVLAVSMIFTGCGKKEGTKNADKKAETTKTIRLENLLFLCEALGISLSDFFADKRFIEAEPKDYNKK